MFTPSDIQSARTRVARITGITLPFCVEAVPRESGLCVTLHRGSARIEADCENSLTRGFFLLTRCVREGRDDYAVTQARRIASCGVMADVSRNAVLKPEAVRRLIDQMAALGLNLLMLYTEDTYEVPGYPYMGHLRGRYTQAELRELDAYAAAAGVELVPCIQTLGHMGQFLQWEDSFPLRDQRDILLADDEAVYAFIDAEIASMRACVRTNRIHIGMDEAHGVGFGRYHALHGDVDRFELLRRHLARVLDICKKHGFEAIMWSDMFFRLGSASNDYYDPQACIPQSVIDAMPDVSLCYWDYYHRDEAFYEHMLAEHARMCKNPVFAGGVWTWSGFLPDIKKSEQTSLPALRACLHSGIQTVLATLWGDDGAETPLLLASGRLPLFSELCWQGEDCPMEEIERAGECLTGLPDAVLRAMGQFYPDDGSEYTGKQLIWCDLLYPLMQGTKDPLPSILRRYDDARATLERYGALDEARYAALLLDIGSIKAALLRDLHTRYLQGDRAFLEHTCEETIPMLLERYAQLLALHRTLWMRDNKRAGWEVICLRYGGVQERLRDVQQELRDYLSGKIDTIEALDETPLPVGRNRVFFSQLVSGSINS